jgi:hypothetical protein
MRGNRDRDGVLDEAELGLPTPTHKTHDTVADSVTAGVRPDGDDGACALHPGDVDRGSGWWRVKTCTLEQVGAVHPCGLDSHEQLALRRDRVGSLASANGARIDHDSLHRPEVTLRK